MYTFTADDTLVVTHEGLIQALWRLSRAACRALRIVLSVVWVEFLCLLDQWAYARLNQEVEP